MPQKKSKLGRPKKQEKMFLLLDQSDYTIIIERIGKSELMKRIGVHSEFGLISWLTNHDVLSGCVVIEDE